MSNYFFARETIRLDAIPAENMAEVKERRQELIGNSHCVINFSVLILNLNIIINIFV